MILRQIETQRDEAIRRLLIVVEGVLIVPPLQGQGIEALFVFLLVVCKDKAIFEPKLVLLAALVKVDLLQDRE